MRSSLFCFWVVAGCFGVDAVGAGRAAGGDDVSGHSNSSAIKSRVGSLGSLQFAITLRREEEQAMSERVANSLAQSQLARFYCSPWSSVSGIPRMIEGSVAAVAVAQLPTAEASANQPTLSVLGTLFT